jgi:hypothetical protein
MNKNILLVRVDSDNAKEYAKITSNEINRLGGNSLGSVYHQNLLERLDKLDCTPENTLLHYRTAIKTVNPVAFQLQEEGLQDNQ